MSRTKARNNKKIVKIEFNARFPWPNCSICVSDVSLQ